MRGATGPTGASGAAGAAGGEVMVNGQLVVTAAAGALTVAVKTLAGADPSAGSPVVFRIPNASGTYDSINVTSALSLTAPSGANLGATANAAFRLWVVAFNNGGTVVLGIGRMSTEYSAMYVCPLADSAAGRNSTLLNTASDGFGIIYSSPAMAFKPMRVLGYIEWNSPGLATVGTWTITNFRCVQLMGLGVRLPGQVVQSIIVSDSNTAIWSGGGPVAGIGYGGFVCYDACNAVRVTAQVILWPDIASGQTAVARLYRDTATTFGGMVQIAGNVGATIIAGGLVVGVDFPNMVSPSAVSYYAKFFATGGTDILRWNPTGLPIVMTIDEIMG